VLIKLTEPAGGTTMSPTQRNYLAEHAADASKHRGPARHTGVRASSHLRGTPRTDFGRRGHSCGRPLRPAHLGREEGDREARRQPEVARGEAKRSGSA